MAMLFWSKKKNGIENDTKCVLYIGQEVARDWGPQEDNKQVVCCSHLSFPPGSRQAPEHSEGAQNPSRACLAVEETEKRAQGDLISKKTYNF